MIAAESGIAAFSGPVGVEEFPTRPVNPLIGVSAEIIPLDLDQVGWKP